MRKELAKQKDKRDRFYGSFGQFGKKSNWKTGNIEKTVLLLDVRDRRGVIITDHLWFNYTKEFERINKKSPLTYGDLLRFDARITSYAKGYEKNQFDYKLSHPTKMYKITKLRFKDQITND